MSLSANTTSPAFQSLLSIDVMKEAQCDPGRVHVVYGWVTINLLGRCYNTSADTVLFSQNVEGLWLERAKSWRVGVSA